MKNIFISIFALFVLFACNNNNAVNTGSGTVENFDHDTLVKNIQSLEKKISTQQTIDYKLGADMVTAYLNFYNHFPKDADTPDYLFKAADVSMNLRQSAKAIELFKRVTELYPKYKKSSFALFLEGFVYETQLKDITQAREIYQKVIKNYPNTKLANDASASIDNLGKSDEELVKEFDKKNKGKL
jgi:tetratricopeptide (TPR) repeat protein